MKTKNKRTKTMRRLALAAALQADDEHMVKPGMVYISLSTELGLASKVISGWQRSKHFPAVSIILSTCSADSTEGVPPPK